MQDVIIFCSNQSKKPGLFLRPIKPQIRRLLMVNALIRLQKLTIQKYKLNAEVLLTFQMSRRSTTVV